MVSRKQVRVSPSPSPRHPVKAGRPAPRTLDKWALRPVARVQRIALFEREVRERLSASALDLVLSGAVVLSEGQRSVRAGGGAYFGSTMLTIDLKALASVLRDACDAGCAARLAGQLASDARAL